MNLAIKLQDPEDIDIEWVYLVLEAKEMGLTIEQIRAFLLKEK